MSRMGTFFNLMTVHKVKVKTSSNWEKICISTVFLLQTFHFFPNLKAIFMIYKYLRRGDYSLGGGRHFSGSNYSAFTKKSNGPTILVTINQCSIRVPPLSTKFQQETMIRYQIRSTCRGGYTGGGIVPLRDVRFLFLNGTFPCISLTENH